MEPVEYLADALTREGIGLTEIGELLSRLESSTDESDVELRCGARSRPARLVGRVVSKELACSCIALLPESESSAKQDLGEAWEWARNQLDRVRLTGGRRARISVLKALVVDPNPHTQEFSKALLRKLGCKTRGANSAGEALALAKGVAFDLVLFDGDISGLGPVGFGELVRSRTEGFWGYTPFVAVTRAGSGTPDAGFSAIIDRPFGLKELNELTKLARLERDARALKTDFLAGLPVIELEAWLDERALLCRLSRALVAQGLEFVAMVGGELGVADPVDVEMEIRSLKNGADILQARRLSAVCQRALDEIEDGAAPVGEGRDYSTLLQEFECFRSFATRRGLLGDDESGR